MALPIQSLFNHYSIPIQSLFNLYLIPIYYPTTIPRNVENNLEAHDQVAVPKDGSRRDIFEEETYVENHMTLNSKFYVNIK